MCMTLSLADEERGSTEFDNYGTDHQGDAMDIAIDDYDDPKFDPKMPSTTFRAWSIGLMWTILIPGVNQFFFFRHPTIIISQVLSFPIGKAWARYLPNISVFSIPLNPGSFTIKEHVVITIMADIGDIPAYATGTIVTQKVIYNQHVPFAYQWLLMSTQLVGFSIGGICKRFLVTPPSMIWPNNLVTAALLNTLHARETSGTHTQARGGASRERFFSYVFVGYIFYNFFPSYLFTALSSFSWVYWIAPNNAKVNKLFGVNHGLSMGIPTFDWGQIASNGSPFPIPWWAAANIGFTVVSFYWFLLPILYYTNVWYSACLPLVSRIIFGNTGKQYDVSRIINSDFSFNLQAYEAYSPVFLPASFVIFYGLSLASITATITHTFLHYRRLVWNEARLPVSKRSDIHARLMSVYKEVPDWWYLSIFVIMFVSGVVVIEVWDTDLPVWGFVLALLISFVFTVPIGVIEAITNLEARLNVITELIIGYAIPDHPITMMLFKTWGHETMIQTLEVTSNLKLAHYIKIAHHTTFFCQVIATIIAGTVQLGVQEWLFSDIEGLCTADQKDSFICPHSSGFSSASVIWSVIGPQRLFSPSQLYFGLVFFLVGILASLFQFILYNKFKIGFLKYINFPIIFMCVNIVLPGTPLNFAPWAIICFIFNYIVRRRYFDWWAKYNYVLSAALDGGYAFGVIIVFFTLQYPKNGMIGLDRIQKWWGNTVYMKMADYTSGNLT